MNEFQVRNAANPDQHLPFHYRLRALSRKQTAPLDNVMQVMRPFEFLKAVITVIISTWTCTTFYLMLLNCKFKPRSKLAAAA